MAKQQNLEVVSEGKLHEINYKFTKRENGSVRIQQDFEFCPSLTDQHSAKETDLNYLMEKFQPDELANYIVARSRSRPEITGYDFSQEPTLQEAKNEAYRLSEAFKTLPEEIQSTFKSVGKFLDYIDDEKNVDAMIKMGLLSRKKIEEIKADPTKTTNQTTNTPESAPKTS